jgi:hypothetical protein
MIWRISSLPGVGGGQIVEKKGDRAIMDGEAMRWMLNFQFMIHLPFKSI